MKRSRIDEMICGQEGLSSLTRQDIQAMQLRKLNGLLLRERERDGFYANLPEKLNSLKELESLPFTTEEDLASHVGGMLLVSQSEIQRVLSDATSGTTGRAKRVFYTAGDCEHTVELFMAGLGELVFPGSVTMICMPFSGPYGLGELIAEAISRLGAKPLKVGVGRSFGQLEEILKREQPDTFVGMPVPLLSMLRFCGKGSLQRALVSADACPESVADACEHILGSRLFPHYGSREMALGGAITCHAHEGMHLRDNHVIAEIIDENGNPLPPGETGQLVITTIGMEAMPLIRYQTGDETRILPGPCSCGSETTRLAPLRRRPSERDSYGLDERLFSLDWLVDYRAEFRGGKLFMEGLTMPGTNLAQAEEKIKGRVPCQVSLRWAAGEDKSMYLGKRRVLTELGKAGKQKEIP